MTPVFVRGVGVVSSLGAAWPATARRLARGEGAIAPVTRFDTSGFPCRVGALVEMREDTTDVADDRRSLLALPAAREAWAHAQLDVDPVRLGVFLGAESGRIPLGTLVALTRAAGGGARFDHERFGRAAKPLASQLSPRLVSPSAPAADIAAELGARGPVRTISLACASGSAAIGEAVRAIRLGVCDVALAGGVGADVDPLMFAGFGLLGALSLRQCSMPFDVRRDGFVVGEGAAMVVLSRDRGDARCAVWGIGRSMDAWRLTAPDPEGRGAEAAMRMALGEAGVDRVDYVQAHGTSTPLNDAVEAHALRRVLGSSLQDAHVSSVKGALGHWIAGAGALGVVCGYEALVNGNVLPTCGLDKVDPECALPHVIGEGVVARVDTALVNAFAFGGANSSIVLGRAA